MSGRKPNRQRMPASILACLVALSNGCASLRPASLASGVPTTHRLAAGHFLISTNFRLNESDQIIRELVSLRDRVHDTLHLPSSSRQIEIYIFDDRPSYERFIRTNYPELPMRRAFFIAQGQREVVYSFWDEKLEEDLRHEVSHALMHSAVGDVPLWLDEGLAEYFETPRESGGLHARHATELKASIRQSWRPALTRLESLSQVSQMTGRDYREAWGWVYFLLHGTPEGREVLLTYLQDLRAGTRGEPLSSRLFAVLSRPDAAMIAFLNRLEPMTPVAGVVSASAVNGR